MKGVGTLIEIGIHIVMKHEQENTKSKINTKKTTNFQTQKMQQSTRVVFISNYCVFNYLQYLAYCS